MRIARVTLEGRRVRLEPLEAARHLEDLARVGDEEEIWRYLAGGSLATRARMSAWIEAKMAQERTRTTFAFAIVDRASERAVGSTSYMEIAEKDRRLEIGGTWLGREARRTAINTECKFLLLRHAFETLGANRVQLKTDARNVRSQAAIERIGATKEGVLRAHMVVSDGFVRDSVMYSIVATEWPRVKARLEGMLAR